MVDLSLMVSLAPVGWPHWHQRGWPAVTASPPPKDTVQYRTACSGCILCPSEALAAASILFFTEDMCLDCQGPCLAAQVKSGVQYSLWGGSVLNLGSEVHRRRYFDDIAQFRLPGCFAMTELKHGAWRTRVQSAPALLRVGRLPRAPDATVPACSCELPWPRCPGRAGRGRATPAYKRTRERHGPVAYVGPRPPPDLSRQAATWRRCRRRRCWTC